MRFSQKTMCVMIGVFIGFLATPSWLFAELKRSLVKDKRSKSKSIVYSQDDVELAREVYDAQGKRILAEGYISDGIYKQYGRKGRLQYEWSYQGGQLEGLSKEYYDGRRVKYEWRYHRGQYHGVSRYYSGYGLVVRERHYLDGVLDGVTRHFYDRGKLKEEITYVQGQKHGLSREYYEKGMLKSEKLFEKDQLISTRLFDENGHALRTLEE